MILAPYAVQPATSRGRLHPEPEAPTRSPWQRDRDRIIHSSAFRKLQYKTQVFVNHEGDFYRTRLTHSIEVAQIARSVARELGLDEDLTEALALAHDLGPSAVRPRRGGGAEPGDEAVRRLRPQRPEPAHRDAAGEPLCRLGRAEPDLGDAGGAGQAQRPAAQPAGLHRRVQRPPPSWTWTRTPRPRRRWRRSPTTSPTTATTWTTGCGRGCSARTISGTCRWCGEALAEARISSLDVPPPRLRHETIRRVINAMVTDLIEETRRRLAKLDPKDADAMRRREAAGGGVRSGDGRGATR